MYVKINGKFRSLNRIIAAVAVVGAIITQIYILPEAVHAEDHFQQQVVDSYRK